MKQAIGTARVAGMVTLDREDTLRLDAGDGSTRTAISHRVGENSEVRCPDCSTRIVLVRDATAWAARRTGEELGGAYDADEERERASALLAEPGACPECTVEQVASAIRAGRILGQYRAEVAALTPAVPVGVEDDSRDEPVDAVWHPSWCMFASLGVNCGGEHLSASADTACTAGRYVRTDDGAAVPC